MELGLQLYSVRDELEKDYVGTLEKVAEIGYRNVELSYQEGLDAKELKQHLDRLQLNVISTHVFPLDKANIAKVIDFNLEIGSSAIVYPIAFIKTKEDILELSKNLNDYGQLCKENKLDFYYHNHFHEFKIFEGDYALDILLENTDPELVKLEFDTYWAVRGGVDPIAYLEKVGGRCDLIHQKDLPESVDPVNIFDVIQDGEITFERFVQFATPEAFTEVGEGTMNINRLVEEGRKLGFAKYIIVEQDLTAKNQLESVEISYRNLTEIL